MLAVLEVCPNCVFEGSRGNAVRVFLSWDKERWICEHIFENENSEKDTEKDMVWITATEAAIIATYCNLKEKGKMRHNIEEKAKEIIARYNLTASQVETLYRKYCKVD